MRDSLNSVVVSSGRGLLVAFNEAKCETQPMAKMTVAGDFVGPRERKTLNRWRWNYQTTGS